MFGHKIKVLCEMSFRWFENVYAKVFKNKVSAKSVGNHIDSIINILLGKVCCNPARQCQGCNL